MKTKRCSQCKIPKSYEEFSPTSHQCKSCSATRSQAYYAAHKDECKAKARYRSKLFAQSRSGRSYRCTTCHQEKRSTEFSPTSRQCKPCGSKRSAMYNKLHPEACRRRSLNYYYKHREERKAMMREESRVARRARLTFLWDYLRAHPCVDCGEGDPVVLQFDHVRDVKKFTISNYHTRDRTKLLQEIAKCDIRCANCHARKTHKERNYFTPQVAFAHTYVGQLLRQYKDSSITTSTSLAT